MPETAAESSLGDVLRRVSGILIRRRWAILLPWCVVSLAGIGVLYQMPNQYTSQATLLVVPQQVPERYVTPTTQTNIADALQVMTQDVLSRTRLLELIDQFGLYTQERKRLAPEEVIELMRRYIELKPVEPASGRGSKDVNAFQISFMAEKAALAQEVTSKLTSFFIQANLKTREDQAANTTNFLHTQLETAKSRLAEQEDKMRQFKAQYLGELPEQLQGNLAIFNSAQSQLQNLENSLDRAQQQKVYLESLIAGYQRLAARVSPVTGVAIPTADPTAVAAPLQIAQTELSRLQTEREKLRVVYRDSHPDVQAINRQIASAQALFDRLQHAAAEQKRTARETAPTQTPVEKDQQDDDSTITQLKSQLEANRLDIENTLRNEATQKAAIAQYQSRLNLTPVREQQLASILRDYDLAKQEYTDLLGKEQQSQLATSLEKQQGGQQFRLVEPPSLPVIPSSPKRIKLSLGALGGGLALGLVFAFVLDLSRPTFHTTKEITSRLGAPLVIGLPLVFTEKEKRRRAWRRVFDWIGGVAVAAVVGAAEFYVLLHP
jgi:polysaccharide chain length determinant protein (PEP-CTERM system associated)